MKVRRGLAVVVAIAFVGVTALWIKTLRAIGADEAQLDSTKAAIKELSHRSPPAHFAAAAKGSAPGAEHSAGKSAAPPDDGAAKSLDSLTAGAWRSIATMRHSTAYAPYWHRSEIRLMERRYGYIIARLGLSAEKHQKLRELLAERDDALRDTSELTEGGGRPDPAASGRAVAPIDDEIKELLGTQTEAFEAPFWAETAYKLGLDGLQAEMSMSGVPITPDQRLALATALYDHRNDPRRPDSHFGDMSEILDSAKRDLSPAQLGVLRNYIQTEDSYAQAQQQGTSQPGP